MSNNSGKQRSSCLMIGPRCTRDTCCQTIAKTSANDLLDKGKFCQNGQIFKGADVLKAGQFMTSRIPTPLVMQDNNTLLIGGETRLCAEVRSWKDGNTGVGTKECGGNQFVLINGGEKK